MNEIFYWAVVIQGAFHTLLRQPRFYKPYLPHTLQSIDYLMFGMTDAPLAPGKYLGILGSDRKWWIVYLFFN